MRDSRLIPSLFAAIVLLSSFWSSQLFAVEVPVLVDEAWLSRNNAGAVVLDVRTRDEYLRGHWPGARWAGFKELDWQLTYNGIPGYLPNSDELSELLGGLGLQGSETVVVVGSAAHPERIAEATRVVWSLMIAGSQQVALLDGGVEALSARELVTVEPSVTPAKYNLRFRPDLLADFDRVEGLLDNNGIVVDFRPTPYFEGEMRDPLVSEGGTILDARGYPPRFLLNKADGQFLSPQTIEQDFDGSEIPTRGPVITFSDTGVWAALGWFVLHRVLDNPHARLYDGSMVEWIDWGGEVHDDTDDMGGPIG